MREHIAAGSLIVFMSGGPTAVMNASLAGIIEAAGSRFVSVRGSRRGVEGLLENDLIDLSRLTAGALERLYRTPAAALGTSRKRPSEEELDRIAAVCRRLGVAGIVAIGGNDTADTVSRLARRPDAPGIVAIPKTIDNDLPGTHYSLGYASAAGFIASSVRDATMDTIGTSQLYPVKFVEVMGRNAGWLAAAGTLDCGGDLPRPLVCLPERPLESFDDLASRISARVDRDGFAVVVVPETMRWRSGQHVAGNEPEYVDPFGHQYFPSAGHALCRQVTERLGLRARYDKPGTLIRASTGRGFRQEARHACQAGIAAVERLAAGESGLMMRLIKEDGTPESLLVEIGVMPVEEVANVERLVPNSMISPSGDGVTQAFFEYALPIIGGANKPYAQLR